MRITLAAIGRLRDSPLNELIERYRRRLPWPLDIVEPSLRQALAPQQRPDAEAVLLLAALPAGAVIITLDERGQTLPSAAFAARLADWRDTGQSRLAFLIGGPDGHGEPAIAAAHLVLSLGQMTWPHDLARLLILEQLYRAHTILTGHPYHRE